LNLRPTGYEAKSKEKFLVCSCIFLYIDFQYALKYHIFFVYWDILNLSQACRKWSFFTPNCRNQVAKLRYVIMAKSASQNKRKSSRFPGVQIRESNVRKHNGKPDICFTIDYIDPQTKKRIRKDIGWASEGFTQAYAAQVRAEHLSKGRLEHNAEFRSIAPKQSFTLQEAFEKYVNEWLLPRGKRHKSDVSLFHTNLPTLVHTDINKIDVYFMDSLIADLTRKGLAPKTVHYIIGIIKRVINKMDDWGLYHGTKPFSKITLPKVNNRRMRFLTPEEAHVLLDELKQHSLAVYLQALISLHCGLRFGEIAELKISDIDFYSKNIYVRDPKNSKSRHQIMTPTLQAELEAYIALTKPLSYLFPNPNGGKAASVSKTFERTVKKLGLNEENGVPITDARQKVVFHTLRHTYASWLALSGQGQAMIAELMGHSSIEMSARYTHLFPDARKATAVAIDNIFKKDVS